MCGECDIKNRIHSELLKIVQRRIDNANTAIRSSIESKNNETKSSAGDKYETGRSMMQFEQEKNELQLGKILRLKNILSQIDLKKEHLKVELGSLVLTNHGSYFISIGIGKIRINEQLFFCISLDSPIGRQLNNKNIGDKCTF